MPDKKKSLPETPPVEAAEEPEEKQVITGVDRVKELLMRMNEALDTIAKVVALIMAIQRGAADKGVGSTYIPAAHALQRGKNDVENSLSWFKDVLTQMEKEAPEIVNAALGTIDAGTKKA